MGKKALTVANIVNGASGMHIASRIPNPASSTLSETFAHGWLRWAGAPKCFEVDLHRSQISRVFFDQAEGRGIIEDPSPAEAHWHMGQVENDARYLRMMGNRTMEDMGIDEEVFQHLLDEFLKWAIWCNTTGICHVDGFSDQRHEFPITFWRTVQTCPLMETQGRFRTQADYRQVSKVSQPSRWMSIGRSRPLRGDYVLVDAVYYWRAGQGVHQSQGHWLLWSEAASRGEMLKGA